MYDSNLVSYTIHQKEYCYNVNKPPIYPDSMQVHIPALMTNIPMGLPKVGPPIALVPTIFANDSSCRPTPSSTVQTQNYVTITRWVNNTPFFPSKDDGVGLLVRYSRFIVDIMNGDIRNMHISNYV